MQAMFAALVSPGALDAGESQALAGSLCTCIERCNHEAQRQTAIQFLPGFLTKVSEYIDNSNGALQGRDADQREVILNNYCSIA